MNSHMKKLVAPIFITSLLVLYYIAFIVGCIFLPMALGLRLLLGLFPLFLAGVCLYVLVERIKEIRSGEEDDLSKY